MNNGPTEGTGPSTALLEASGVTVRPAGWDIVAGIDVSVQAGEIVSLLGPNGAGKTTLLRALLGLSPLAAGQVLLAGQPLAALPGDERARRLAYVPQHSNLTARLSARAVVELGRFPHRGMRAGLSRQDRTRVEEALAATDCAYLSERSFISCSGGEQARLLVARALATEAPCLLLDEPAANLDVAHALELFALLRRLADTGKGILVVMHDLDHARRWSDRAYLLDSGRCVASGAINEVVTPELIERIYKVRMVTNGGLGYEALERKT